MANGIGVSVSKRKRKGKAAWVVRWRVRQEAPDGWKWASRQRQVSAEAAAVELHASVLRSLEVGEAPVVEYVAEPVVAGTTFDQIGVAWLKRKEARAVAPATLKRYARSIQKFAEVVRFLKGLGEEQPIPASLLTDALMDEVAAELRVPSKGRRVVSRRRLRNGKEQVRSSPARPSSDSDLYATMQRALEAWTLGARRFEDVPRPPAEVAVPPPLYEAGPAPTMEHCDAVLRQLSRSRSAFVGLAAAVLMRWTGLRVAQVQMLAWEHLDRDGRTLTLPAEAGKSRREKAMARTIPIAQGLLDDLDRLAELRAPHPTWIVPRRKDREVGPKAGSSPSTTIRRAWERATELDGVPEQVWKPRNRKQARPDHAFRAAL